MKHFYILMITCIICSLNNTASQSIAINSTGAPPQSSAMLDVSSTSKGMLIPRLTTAQRKAIVNPANGWMIFDSSVNT